MPLSTGSRLGPYEIVAPLGAGGMGEVYKARDTRLDRMVAIKVLPEHIAKREDLRARFEREARAVASLNHPHICVLHDIGGEDGVGGYMVMEYLEGETLEACLERGALPLEGALRYAMQISDALDRAHRAGVTHRDIKPGNIMLTRDGVKVLDFGLAKSTAKPGPTDATVVKSLTTEGTVLGTPQYMAPEQIEGKETDARCDIWAFGAVLYEIVTGQKAFQGKSYASLIGAILTKDPSPMTARVLTPVALEKLVRRCLEKDAEDRWHCMRDVLLELRSISRKPEAAQQSPGKRPLLAWMLAGLATAAALSIAAIHFREQPTKPRPIRFEIPMPEGATVREWQVPTVSPDGTRIGFSAIQANTNGGFFSRTLSAPAPQILLNRPVMDQCWSADSRSVVVVEAGSIQRAEISGGPAQKLFDISATGGGVACSPETILIGNRSGPLLQGHTSGGALRVLTKLDTSRQETGHMFPEFLPDNRGFIFTAASQGSGSIFVGSLDSPQVKLLLPNVYRAIFVPNGYLLYRMGTALVARRFDWKALRFVGEPARITDSVFESESYGYVHFYASPDVLAYREGFAKPGSELVWFDRAGKRLSTVGERALYSGPALSPDGNRLAVGRGDPVAGTRDIWIIDLARGASSRFTFDPGDDLNPVWSPDGEEIVFSSNRLATNNERHLFRKAANGTSAEQALSEGSGRHSVEAWSPDGKFLVFNNSDDLVMVPSAGGKMQTIIAGPTVQDQASFSPDGKWIAYRSGESGRMEIYVQSFPPGDGRWQISTQGGYQPSWRGDSKELFYLQDNQVMSVPVKGAGKRFEAGTPSLLFNIKPPPTTGRNYYVVTRDGSRFLFLTSSADLGKAPIQLIVNWAAGLPK